MLDLRLPIGYFFLINAALLILDGVLQHGASNVTLAGYSFNLNIVWGLVMFVFGACMAGFAWKARKAGKSE
jgi:hypothetical protein